MTSTIPIRAVLMSSDIKADGTGFHKLTFKVDGGRSGVASVAVMISLDAHRKLTTQLARARMARVEKSVMLKTWCLWALAERLEDLGTLPSTLTITASDIDDFGAYASDLGRVLRAAS